MSIRTNEGKYNKQAAYIIGFVAKWATIAVLAYYGCLWCQ